jgi:hypothetical protein
MEEKMEEINKITDLPGNGSPESPRNNGLPLSRTIWLLGQLVLTIGICCAAIFAYDQFFAAKVSTVDLRAMVESQQSLHAAGKLTEEYMVEQYQTLDKRLKDLPKNRIVILADTVFKTDSRNVMPVQTTDK